LLKNREKLTSRPVFDHGNGPESHSGAQPLPTLPDLLRNFYKKSQAANPCIPEDVDHGKEEPFQNSNKWRGRGGF
jgi:hypothetical protein